MTFDPILNAPLYIQLHAGAAVVALGLGPWVIFRNRRDLLHKIGGYIWVMAMACAAISSFWIQQIQIIGPFSPIHGLALYTLWSLYRGVSYAIARNIVAHQLTFRALYLQGLVLAGLFTLLPGRTLSDMFFKQTPMVGVAILVLGSGFIVWRFVRGMKEQRSAVLQ
jgi:uncharacterized membrane protein